MFKFNELQQIHLEITNNCQASCPMCVRNNHGGAENPLLKINNWSLEDFKTIINKEVLEQVSSIYFCGNYGDPLLNNSLIEMVQYATAVNKDLNIRIHTNGSLRSTIWWENLARALPINHRVIFAIDGLRDTNHIYRIGTNYDTIIKNATAFINAGGNAEWAFIRFKHNEHQVNEARKIAADLRFQNFTMKDSSRFVLDSKFPVYDKDKTVISYLEPSQYSEIKFIDRNIVNSYKKIANESTINCYALKNKEIFIDAFYNVYPCCFLGIIPYSYSDELSEVSVIRKDILEQYNQLISDFGGIESLDATQHSVCNIINSNTYQTIWDKYWSDPKLITCARTCGVNNISKPFDQFTTRENLNE